MRPDDFFVESGEADMFGIPTRVLDEDLVTRIHAGVSDRSDVEVSVPLARLLHEEFEKFGTGGGQEFTSAQAQAAMRALQATLRRLGVEFTPPFADFDSFYSYWKRNGASGTGGWQARRDILSALFDPLHDQLADIQAVALRSELAMPVGDRPRTGWTRVDAEVAELRRHFQAARTPQDYRNVGNDCVIILERLSEAAYDPARHLGPDEEEPPAAKTKTRLDRVVEVELEGAHNAELRKLARAAIEQAQAVKHRTPDRDRCGLGHHACEHFEARVRPRVLTSGPTRRLGGWWFISP